MVTSPGCVCTITSSQLAIGRRPAVAAARLFTPASLKWYRSWISLTKSNNRQCVLASLCGILYHLVSTSLTSASSCRSSYKRGCDECSIQWTHDRKHVLILWITREPYLQCGDDHQSPSVNNTPLSFTWVYILNMTWWFVLKLCFSPVWDLVHRGPPAPGQFRQEGLPSAESHYERPPRAFLPWRGRTSPRRLSDPPPPSQVVAAPG